MLFSWQWQLLCTFQLPTHQLPNKHLMSTYYVPSSMPGARTQMQEKQIWPLINFRVHSLVGQMFSRCCFIIVPTLELKKIVIVRRSIVASGKQLLTVWVGVRIPVFSRTACLAAQKFSPDLVPAHYSVATQGEHVNGQSTGLGFRSFSSRSGSLNWRQPLILSEPPFLLL